MAATYTLEEAADKLDLSLEEFKRRLRTEWTHVRSFRDGPTLRFRANEIDELARSIGLGSSEELPLADSGFDLPPATSVTDDSGESPKKSPAAKKEGGSGAPLKLDDSDETFLISPDEPGKSPSSKKLKAKSDSDVRLEKSKAPVTDDEESILTEEFDTSSSGSGKLSGKSGKLSAAKLKSDSGKLKSSESGSSKKSAAAKADDSSSEFELSLEADSDEFELSLAPDSSEEVPLGEAQAAPAGSKAGQSGINLNKPADSGISLEKRKKKGDDEEIDFELSLETPGSGASGKKSSSGKLGKKKLAADSDSEFELTLEEPSDLALEGSGEKAADKKGDIFEATDFEIPALEDDSASEAVSLEESDTDLESSDFDLALDEADVAADDESASEVVAIEEEEVRSKKKKIKKKKVADDDDESDVDLGDLDDEESAADALAGVHEEREIEEREVIVQTVPARWGALPAVLMFPTVLILFLGGLMAFETLHSVWGYQQSTKPTTPLITWFSDTLGMKPAQ